MALMHRYQQAVDELLAKINVDLTFNENGEQIVLLNGEDVSSLIRTPEISMYASDVSAIPEVRAFLLDLQRNMAKTNNIIMDGRDIGTVVLPDAKVKIFLTASAEVRAKRRYDELIEKGIRIIFLGDKGALSKKLAEKMEKLEEKSAHNKAILNVAVNYGARDELVHAVNTLLKEKKSEITADDINAHLYTKNSPDPDLIVRTGGDFRISNFLLWQSAYSELYFTNTLWPDFDAKVLDKALVSYQSRQRRFGGV